MSKNNGQKQKIPKTSKLFFIGVKVIRFFARLLPIAKAELHFDKKEIKDKPVVILSDHAAYSNIIYVVYGYPVMGPIHSVVGACHPRTPKIGWLIGFTGAILKKMYVSDLKATINMARVIRAKESLLIFPEGMYSYCGVTHPINYSIAGFLKKLKADVVVVSTKGAYLTHPRVSKDKKKGLIKVDLYHIYSPEELETASNDEIYEKLMSTISFNDFEWNAKENNRYIGKKPNADGFEKVLYRCPKCGQEGYMYSEGNKIICGNCNNKITVDETYKIAPATEADVLPYERIDQWYLDQRRILREEVRNNEAFEMKLKVGYNILNMENRKSMFINTGEGEITINRDGVSYKGTNAGKEEEFLLPIKGFQGSSNQQNRYMVMFRNNEVIAFDVGDVRSPMIAKACAAIEELHALTDPDWDRALKRVYM